MIVANLLGEMTNDNSSSEMMERVKAKLNDLLRKYK